MTRERLTFVIAAYNEAQALPLLHPRLRAVLDGMPDIDGHILYVDDGSHDGTWAVIAGLAQADPRVSALKLSRNFGKEAALTAGIDTATGDAVIPIDADLQHPPELIIDMVREWENGIDIVLARRTSRNTDHFVQRWITQWFYRLHNHISECEIPRDVVDGLLEQAVRRALDRVLARRRDRHRWRTPSRRGHR